jgi:serine phosphatase RsbU (regulator of sigma subunit)
MNRQQEGSAPDIKKHQRLKRTLIQNTSYSVINYCLGTILTLIAIAAGYSTMPVPAVFMISVTGLVLTLFCMGITALQRTITARFSLFILLLQYLIFMVLFAAWVVLLNEARVISLFLIVVTCLFLVFESSFIQSIIVISVLSLTYAGSVWYGVAVLGQKGSPWLDLFMLACFIPSGIMISVLASSFRRQRLGLKQAKHQSDQARNDAERARDALWGEMELAKKIQTVLLPEKPAISGFEITTYMKPAEEVGGDYYDIINVEGRDWIVIGDVSGHGVSAGLIMMIVQTAIKMVLAQNPDIEPSKLLTLINSTIARDMKKISEDKYMTITVLALHENGRFHFAGLHQDIIVYRAESGRVETIDTDGVWLGIMNEIGDMMHDGMLSMGVNDIMMIFTDGITEARRDDTKTTPGDAVIDMYGESRLIDLIARFGSEGPEKIKKELLASLAGYVTRDDVTFVILKRVK